MDILPRPLLEHWTHLFNYPLTTPGYLLDISNLSYPRLNSQRCPPKPCFAPTLPSQWLASSFFELLRPKMQESSLTPLFLTHPLPNHQQFCWPPLWNVPRSRILPATSTAPTMAQTTIMSHLACPTACWEVSLAPPRLILHTAAGMWLPKEAELCLSSTQPLRYRPESSLKTFTCCLPFPPSPAGLCNLCSLCVACSLG